MNPESLMAYHMIRWQQEKMARPEWQHRAALTAAAVPWHKRVSARAQVLRTRWARSEPALSGSSR
jgi:hypothetical protein